MKTAETLLQMAARTEARVASLEKRVDAALLRADVETDQKVVAR